MSLFRQKEMMNDANIIPLSSISKWHLDCQKETTKDEALVMAVRHYSCVGDTIRVVSDCGCAIDVADRLISLPFRGRIYRYSSSLCRVFSSSQISACRAFSSAMSSL